MEQEQLQIAYERALLRAIIGSFVSMRPKTKVKAPFGQLVKIQPPTEQQEQEQECQVCLDTNSNMSTACNHRFCEPCLKHWYNQCNKNQFSCPMCRSRIVSLYKDYAPVDVSSLD
jgi:hypothetical protein